MFVVFFSLKVRPPGPNSWHASVLPWSQVRTRSFLNSHNKKNGWRLLSWASVDSTRVSFTLGCTRKIDDALNSNGDDDFGQHHQLLDAAALRTRSRPRH